jgi:hypothetical protein
VHQNGFNSLSQQKDALSPLFEKTVTGVDKNGDFEYKCTIKNGDEEISVCRSAWATAHNVSLTMLETLAKEKKNGMSLFS